MTRLIRSPYSQTYTSPRTNAPFRSYTSYNSDHNYPRIPQEQTKITRGVFIQHNEYRRTSEANPSMRDVSGRVAGHGEIRR